MSTPAGSRSTSSRVLAGFDGDDLVATARNYGLELTVPGGTLLPTAGVDAVTVRPAHRRKGCCAR